MNKILGFAPDADASQAGVLLACKNMLPNSKGMHPAPAAVSTGVAALPKSVRGAMAAVDLVGARIAVAGTDQALYRLGGMTWTNLTPTYSFALGGDECWSFGQFANSTLASTLTTGLLISTGANFERITTAPRAKILVVLKGFVMAFNTEDAAYGVSTDRWWCSAYLNASDWHPSVSTQCTTGRLVESGGAISAAERLGDDVVVYKRRSIFLGRYTGPAEVWNFAHIDSEVGCVGQDAVCSTGKVHYFIGDDDFYAFDGVQAKPLGRGVLRDWYASERDPKSVHKSVAFWDKINQLAWFFFPSARAGGVVDRGVVYHPDSGRWGCVETGVQTMLRYASPPATYESGIAQVLSYESGPSIPFDSPFWLESQEMLAGFDSSNQLVTFSGIPLESSFTTGDFGDDEVCTWCDRLTLRFEKSPAAASAAGKTKDDSGVGAQQASQAIREGGFFDLRQRGRWHQFEVTLNGDFMLTGIRPRLKQAGRK